MEFYGSPIHLPMDMGGQCCIVGCTSLNLVAVPNLYEQVGTTVLLSSCKTDSVKQICKQGQTDGQCELICYFVNFKDKKLIYCHDRSNKMLFLLLLLPGRCLAQKMEVAGSS